MKLVKNNKFGSITTTIDGSFYHITQEGCLASDEVAQRMKEQFLHEIEVEDIAPIEKPQSPADITNE